MGTILAFSTRRAFISRVGRVEVFGRSRRRMARARRGPHTHVLSKLLRTGRTHAATEPSPAGWLGLIPIYSKLKSYGGWQIARSNSAPIATTTKTAQPCAQFSHEDVLHLTGYR